MGRLDGATAIVTGAARGIGAAVARRFVEEGAATILADVQDAEGSALAADLGPAARYVHLDVTAEEGWQKAVTEAQRAYGAVTVLVNNAGILDFGTIETQSPADFQRLLHVNLFGAWLGMHTVASALRAAEGGTIVNMSSTAGLVGYAGIGAYTASKWGLRGLTKTAALELAGDGIRVCSVHPGPIRTPMTAGFDDSVVAGQPIPRFGEPEEVAAMVVFIVAEGTYSTGTEFIVDGGTSTGTVTAPISVK